MNRAGLVCAVSAVCWTAGCAEAPPPVGAPEGDPIQPQSDAGFYQDVAWAPDGSRLLISVMEWGEGPDGYSYRIHQIDADGGNFRALTPGPRDRWVSWSPGGDRVVFASVREGNDDIYTMAPDGSDVVRLTEDPAVDTHPQFSPDGRRIAFVSHRSGEAEVWLMNADGTEPTLLLDAEGEPNNPAWSPDGERLAFYAAGEDGVDRVWVVTADGSVASVVAEGVWPSWSADGARVLFSGDEGLYEVTLAGTARRILAGDVNFARWDPEGGRLAYITTDSAGVTVHVARPDGSSHLALLRRPRPNW